MAYPMCCYLRTHNFIPQILKVRDDINLETGNFTALTMLNLLSAINTIDHDILIRRLLMWSMIKRVFLVNMNTLY